MHYHSGRATERVLSTTEKALTAYTQEGEQNTQHMASVSCCRILTDTSSPKAHSDHALTGKQTVAVEGVDTLFGAL